MIKKILKGPFLIYSGAFFLLLIWLTAMFHIIKYSKPRSQDVEKKEFIIYICGFLDGRASVGLTTNNMRAMEIMINNATNQVWSLKNK